MILRNKEEIRKLLVILALKWPTDMIIEDCETKPYSSVLFKPTDTNIKDYIAFHINYALKKNLINQIDDLYNKMRNVITRHYLIRFMMIPTAIAGALLFKNLWFLSLAIFTVSFIISYIYLSVSLPKFKSQSELRSYIESHFDELVNDIERIFYKKHVTRLEDKLINLQWTRIKQLFWSKNYHFKE
jgi:hypothetical protein